MMIKRGDPSSKKSPAKAHGISPGETDVSLISPCGDHLNTPTAATEETGNISFQRLFFLQMFGHVLALVQESPDFDRFLFFLDHVEYQVIPDREKTDLVLHGI